MHNFKCGDLMNNQLYGLILSYSLVGLILILSLLLAKINTKQEYNRKFIHISISHWWIIAMLYFESVFIASIPPITFLFANILSRRYNLIKPMERKHDRDLGTIYYPLSLLILTIFSFGYLKTPYIGSIGIFILGYGDGLAAVIGKRYGRFKLHRNKSLAGSLTMFTVTFLVMLILLSIFNPIHILAFSLIIALIATLLELYSPYGTDNLTVPIITTFIYYYMTLLI
jgi:phytol kinase